MHGLNEFLYIVWTSWASLMRWQLVHNGSNAGSNGNLFEPAVEPVVNLNVSEKQGFKPANKTIIFPYNQCVPVYTLYACLPVQCQDGSS